MGKFNPIQIPIGVQKEDDKVTNGIIPKRMTSRVAAYSDAIKEARAEGLTWNEIGSLIGIDSGIKLRRAFVRATAGIESGRLAPRQFPLPGLQSVPSDKLPIISDTSKAIPESRVVEDKSPFGKKREPAIKFDDD